MTLGGVAWGYAPPAAAVTFNANPDRLCRVLPGNEEATDVLLRIKDAIDNDMENYLSMIGLMATPTNYGTEGPDEWVGPGLVEVFRKMEKDHMADAMETVTRQVEHLLEAVRRKDALVAAVVALR
jgi:hypothetical protein